MEYLKVRYQNSHGNAEEYHEQSQSKEPAGGSRLETVNLTMVKCFRFSQHIRGYS
jgi:hypothetical protein